MNGRVEIIAGTLGGGKSLVGVERAFYHLTHGGVVYTNIEIHREAMAEAMAERHSLKMDQSRLRILPKTTLRGFHDVLERGTADMPVLVVLDEAALEWSNRDYAKTAKDSKGAELLNFVTLVRKLDIVLLFITQNPVGIDKAIRDKANLLTMCRNYRYWQFMGIFGLPFNLMRRVHYDIAVGGKATKIYGEFVLFRSWLFPLYNSDALLGEKAEMFEALEIAKTGPLQKLPMSEKRKFRWLENVSVFVVCLIIFV